MKQSHLKRLQRLEEHHRRQAQADLDSMFDSLSDTELEAVISLWKKREECSQAGIETILTPQEEAIVPFIAKWTLAHAEAGGFPSKA